jgi:hypothetical protein
MLPETVPAAELAAVWPAANAFLSDSSAQQCSRIYKFDFLPLGFFARMMVRFLHIGWQERCYWQAGIVMVKGDATFLLQLHQEIPELHIHLRGAGAGQVPVAR